MTPDEALAWADAWKNPDRQDSDEESGLIKAWWQARDAADALAAEVRYLRQHQERLDEWIMNYPIDGRTLASTAIMPLPEGPGGDG